MIRVLRHSSPRVHERTRSSPGRLRRGRKLFSPSRHLLCLMSAGFLLASTASAEGESPSGGIGLALGSGGAGGLAHIAMLEEFDRRELRPDVIAGTSIGALIGAMYAAGLSAEEIRELFTVFGESALNPFSGLLGNAPGWTDLVRTDWGNGGFIDPSGFMDFIGQHFEARRFEDLEIPLKIVAANYWDGQSVIFEEGDLFSAIKASMAVPGLFPPVRREEMLLIDGGVVNPLPWDLVAEQGLVIAVDVTGFRDPTRDDEPDLFDLLFKTFEIMQQSLISEKMAAGPPDLHVKPRLHGIRLLHFDRIDAILERAAEAAAELGEELDRWQAAEVEGLRAAFRESPAA